MGIYDELYHHGVKGQKWGVRRTAAQLGHRVAKAGKAAGKFAGKQTIKAKKAVVAAVKQKHAENKEKRYYKKLHKKKLSQMTDKEITDLTKRVKIEASLKSEKYESRVQNARKFYKNVAQEPLNTYLNEYSKAAIKKAFGDDGKVKNVVQGKPPKSITTKQEESNGPNDVSFEVNMVNEKRRNPVIIRHEG